MAEPRTSTRWPHRLVDRADVGWHLVSGGGYETSPDLELGTWSLERILAERAPVRDVVEPPNADIELIRGALQHAGRLAAGSLAVALHRAVVRHRSSGPIVAGRPGSSESYILPWVAWQIGGRLDDQQRFDRETVDVLAEVIGRWTDPGQPVYVEVGENLAQLFGEVTEAAGGWAQVSDDLMDPAWQRRAGAAGDDPDEVATLRSYLTSTLTP